MAHIIEFCKGFTADVQVLSKKRMERIRIRNGMQACVEVRPYVLETQKGPVEAADLYFKEGCVIHNVLYEDFRFVD